MHFIQRTARILFSIYGFAVFLLLMFALFPFVVIASFFGKVTGGNIIYTICRFWAKASLFAWGIRHRNIYEAPHDAGHACIFVFNHISFMDIPLLLLAFGKQHIRVLGKAELSKVPVFGFIYRKAAVTVDRSDAKHRAQSVETLKMVLKKNISIVMAPEGTFNMTHAPLKDFYDGAFRIAIETQTPIKPVVFLDAYDRLPYENLFSLNPGKSRAIFLPEVQVVGLTMGQLDMLKKKVYDNMEAALINAHASWIKTSQ